jgi:mannitol-1-phosphate/altronate dehydrogenase
LRVWYVSFLLALSPIEDILARELTSSRVNKLGLTQHTTIAPPAAEIDIQTYKDWHSAKLPANPRLWHTIHQCKPLPKQKVKQAIWNLCTYRHKIIRASTPLTLMKESYA